MICYNNWDMLKKLLEITSKIDLLVMKNEELTSQLTMAQNTSKVLQQAFNTISSKLVEVRDNIINWNSIPGGNT